MRGTSFPSRTPRRGGGAFGAAPAPPGRASRGGERVPTRLARDGGMPAYLLRGMRLDVFRRSLLGRYRRRYISIIKTWAREKVRPPRGGGKPDGGEPQAEWVG